MQPAAELATGDDLSKAVWHNPLYSFRSEWKKNMTYESFIEKVKGEDIPGQHVLRESRTIEQDDKRADPKLYLDIKDDVVEPEFYANFAKLETIELMQGATINEKPHYEK